MTTPWYSTWLLRPLAFVAVVILVPMTALAVLTGPETQFESSDVIWHDGTDHLKGRSFSTVQADFERYRQLCIRPNVALVRTTKMEWWNPLFYYYYASKPQWRVSWAPQRGCLMKRCGPLGSPDCTGNE
jgi:hypothetical protein